MGLHSLCGILQVDAGYLHSRASFFVTFLGQDLASEMPEMAGGVSPTARCQKAVALSKKN